MEQYIQCGDIAENPLYVKELGIHIYTAEEFCYYIFNNTYLLGEDFIRQEVIDFFRVELHMPELADKIVKFYGSSADMGAVLVMIMREIGYYEENQIQQFQNRLDRMNRQSLWSAARKEEIFCLIKGALNVRFRSTARHCRAKRSSAEASILWSDSAAYGCGLSSHGICG